MSRNTREITIESGRDEGKKFIILESSAAESEELAYEITAIFADMVAKGAASVSAEAGKPLVDINPIRIIMGLVSGGGINALRPLFKKLEKCITYIGEEKDTTPAKPLNFEKAPIEDVPTRMLLRREALLVHLDFLDEGHFLKKLLDFSTIKDELQKLAETDSDTQAPATPATQI